MESFVYTANPSRVVFGRDTLRRLPDELARRDVKSALILCTPRQVSKAEDIKQLIGDRAAGIFSEATMHTPSAVTERALQASSDMNVDSVVSFGGGSTVGLGKAISVRTGVPHICIPTTYAGSEMTPILGETVDGVKTTRSDPKILPGTVIYDVELTMSLPAGISAISGVNAIAHAVEALYAPDTNPIINLLAKEAIRALAESLPVIVKSTKDSAARSRALYGAWLCGSCLGTTSMSLHHKLCHTLGGSFNLPHAETHTILLPHSVAYNFTSAPEAMKSIAECLPDSDGNAVKGLNVLLDKLGVKRALKDFGMKEEDVAKAAALATKNSYGNPREIKEEPIRELIRRAWAGDPASVDL